MTFDVCPFRLSAEEWVPLAVEEDGECGWMQAEFEDEDGPLLHLVKTRSIARHEVRGQMIRLSADDDEVIHFYELEGESDPLALQFVTREDAEEANRQVCQLLEARERRAETTRVYLEQLGFASKHILSAQQALGRSADSRELISWIFDNVREDGNAISSSPPLGAAASNADQAASAEQLVAEWAAKQGFPDPDDPVLESKIDQADAWSVYSGSPTAAAASSPRGGGGGGGSRSPRLNRNRKPPPPPKRPAPSNAPNAEEKGPPPPPTLQQLRVAAATQSLQQQQEQQQQQLARGREERQRRRRPPPPKSPPRDGQRKRADERMLEKEVTKEAQKAVESMSLKRGEEEEELMSLVDFVPVRRLGSGAFSTVILVRKEDDGGLYAMKVMEKQAILKAGLEHAVKIEREVLRVIRHSFLVQLRYAFQTVRKIYILTDFYAAGSLDDALRLTNRRGLGVEVARFVCSELALALSHLHTQGILHRDVKAANVLLDAKGHAHLADYGLAKVMEKKKQQKKKLSFAGTLEYMAPEFIAKKAKVVGAASDWWALGCLLAETAQGFTPFRADTPRQLMANIIRGEPVIKFDQLRHVLSDLLQRDPNLRLADIRSVALHPFFQSIDFPALSKKNVEPPFTPKLESLAPDSDVNEIFKQHYLEFAEQFDDQNPRRRARRRAAEPPPDFVKRKDDLPFLGFSYPYQQ